MRPGRIAGLAVAAALAVGASAELSAHRRDEQLQAARIAIEPGQVTVDLDITPGVDLAEAAIGAVDPDRNGTLSPAERDAYAQAVAGALWLANDREAHALRLVSATFPELAAIRRGDGTIALRLQAALRQPSDGRHELIFGNGHEATRSVYLANALVPRSGRVTIAGQRRSANQHELTIDYTVADDAPSLAARVLVTLAAGALLLVPLVRRVRRGGTA